MTSSKSRNSQTLFSFASSPNAERA